VAARKNKDQASKHSEHLQKDYDAVLSTAAGRNVMRHILFLSEYTAELKSYNVQTLELDHYGTIYNIGRRDIWFAVRQFLRPEHRMQIEYEIEKLKEQIAFESTKANEKIIAQQQFELEKFEQEVLESIDEDKE